MTKCSINKTNPIGLVLFPHIVFFVELFDSPAFFVEFLAACIKRFIQAAKNSTKKAGESNSSTKNTIWGNKTSPMGFVLFIEHFVILCGE